MLIDRGEQAGCLLGVVVAVDSRLVHHRFKPCLARSLQFSLHTPLSHEGRRSARRKVATATPRGIVWHRN